MDAHFTFTKRVDVVSPRSAGDNDSPVLRENYFSRNMRLETVKGTERAIDQLVTAKITGMWRYYSRESGIENPKTIAYTIDGKLWHIDEHNKSVHVIKTGLNTDAYPNAIIYKLGEQYYFYLVDGLYLWEWDGNASYIIDDKTPKQSDGSSYEPIDIIEHLDRIVLLTERQALISANLEPTNFSSAADSIEIILGSGKGINKALGKLNDRLYFFSTEGAFVLTGDVLSAVASTFSIEKVDPTVKVQIGSTVANVEGAIMYLGDDLELYTFNGNTKELLSYPEQLKRLINPQDTYLAKAVSHYDSYDKRYYLSVVETGETENNLEIVYDAVESKIDFIRGRKVSAYCQYDGTREPNELLLGNTTTWTVLYANRGKNFDGVGIRRRLRSRDIYFNKGQRGRIMAFYPEIEPVGNLDLSIRYLLDSRLSDYTKETYGDGTRTVSTGSVSSGASFYFVGGYFKAQAIGSVSTISAKVSGVGGGKGTMKVYTYSGSTTTLVGTSDQSAALPATQTWTAFTFSTAFNVTKDTEYIIAVACTAGGSINVYYDNYDTEKVVYVNNGTSKLYNTNFAVQALIYSSGYFAYKERTEQARFDQSLAGEQKGLGFINITNQSQFIDRVRPRIDYAMGSSITFEIDEAEKNLGYSLLGIGLDVTSKHAVKGKKVGQ